MLPRTFQWYRKNKKEEKKHSKVHRELHLKTKGKTSRRARSKNRPLRLNQNAKNRRDKYTVLAILLPKTRFSHEKLFPNSTSPTNETVCTDYEDCYTYVEPDTIPIPPPSPPSVSNDGISPYVIIVIVVLVSIFLLISYYTFVVKFCSGWNVFRRRTPRVGSNVPDEQQQEDTEYQVLDRGLVDSEIEHPIWLIRTAGLQQTIINSIAVVRYKKGEGLIEGTDCSVCLSEFQEGETLRLLPKCDHAFHIACIDTWLRSHTNCPLCRAGIVSNPGRPSLASTATDRSPTNSTRTEVTGSEIGNDVESGGTDQYNGHLRSSSGVGDINGIGTAARDSIELIQVNRVQIKAEDLNNPNGQNSFFNNYHHYLDDDEVQLVRRSISMEHFSADRVHSHLGNIMDHRFHGMDLYYSVHKTTAAAASESHGTATTFINSKLDAGSSSLAQYSTPLAMKRSSSWCGRVSSAGFDRASNSKLSP